MANGRHSFVAFYPSDWLGGTARLPRMHRSILFDVCCFIWDHARPCPPTEQAAMLCDVVGWRDIVADLIAMGKLTREDDGSLSNSKAMAEAEKAFKAWKAMSDAGKGAGRGRGKGANRDANSPPIRDVDNAAGSEVDSAPNREPEPEPELSKDNISDTNVSVSDFDQAKVVEAWNEMAGRRGLPQVRLPLQRARRQKLAARMREYPIDDWIAAFDAIERSSFLLGETGWRGASFDFLLQPSSFQKVIEGNYDNGKRTH